MRGAEYYGAAPVGARFFRVRPAPDLADVGSGFLVYAYLALGFGPERRSATGQNQSLARSALSGRKMLIADISLQQAEGSHRLETNMYL
jgi:hypothetical protein